MVAGKEAQYDEKAKQLLGNKIILAHILVNILDEFKGMDPKEVITYIEGEAQIGVVPVDPGLTNTSENQKTERLVGFNTENSEINEGLIRFDIIFYIRLQDGISQIIINIEAQKSEPLEYDLLNRAIFYICRMVSSQKGRDFVKTNYNDIKRVYSIWICMNMEENSLSHIHLTEENVICSHEWKGDQKLLNLVFIGLSKELPEKEEKYELHRLLVALLSSTLSIESKLNILETEYQIPVEEPRRKDVREMCNLGEGIREEVKNEIIIRMLKKEQYAYEEIAEIAGTSIDTVKKIAESGKVLTK